MSELLSQAKLAGLYWALLMFRMCLHSAATLCLAWVACTQNIEFNSLSRWSKITLLATIVALWADKLNAFLDQTLSRLARGKLPTENGGTNPPFLPEPQHKP